MLSTILGSGWGGLCKELTFQGELLMIRRKQLLEFMRPFQVEVNINLQSLRIKTGQKKLLGLEHGAMGTGGHEISLILTK